MNQRLHYLQLFLGLSLFLIAPGFAHHTGPSAAAAGSRTMLYQDTTVQPTSRVFATVDMAQLDNAVGQLYTATLGGEWAVHRRASLMGAIPTTYVAHNFQAETAGVGDLTIGAKVQLLDQPRIFSLLSVLWNFPTGRESDGLGRGSVGQQITSVSGVRWGDWTAFVTPGVSFGYAAPHEPMIHIGAGIGTPTYKERWSVSLAATAQIVATSDVLANGSWKLFVEPQLNWLVDQQQRVTVSLSGRAAIVDALSRKSGVTLANTSHALLNDVRWGATVGVHYAF